MTNSAKGDRSAEYSTPVSVDELAHQQGVTTAKTIDDLAVDDIFETDEEVDEFLTFVREQRNASLA